MTKVKITGKSQYFDRLHPKDREEGEKLIGATVLKSQNKSEFLYPCFYHPVSNEEWNLKYYTYVEVETIDVTDTVLATGTVELTLEQWFDKRLIVAAGMIANNPNTVWTTALLDEVIACTGFKLKPQLVDQEVPKNKETQ